MKKNKLITLTIIALLGLGTVGTINDVTNVTAQAKTTHVAKKTHKKHVTKKATKKTTKKLSKHEKLLQELRDQIDHPEKYKKQYSASKNNQNSQTSNQNNGNSVDGYNATTQTITDINKYNEVGAEAGLNTLNQFRKSLGLNPVVLDSNLNKIAQLRAQDEIKYSFNTNWYDGHHTQDGQLFAQVEANQLGITLGQLFGENTTASNAFSEGGADAANVNIQEYINEGITGGHYQNLANPKYTKVGIGLASDNSSDTSGFAMEFQ